MSSRRFSQAISEGDGISVLVPVADLEHAYAAEGQGAEGVVVVGELPGVREAVAVPILWHAGGSPDEAAEAGADACLLVVAPYRDDLERLAQLHAEVVGLGLECVVEVRDEEELELALERIDPEIVLLSSRGAEEDESALDRVLDLLPDVPAGKLAIAELDAQTREEVLALERAGIDAVIVRPGDVTALVGAAPPAV